uniref:Uncharacterized protein n=1 Tax=Ixodes ricinus TaxID=34613 RepID=A0A6B0UHH5_IXORI
MSRNMPAPLRAAVLVARGSSASSSRNSRKSGSTRSDGCWAVRCRKRSRAARLRSTKSSEATPSSLDILILVMPGMRYVSATPTPKQGPKRAPP